MPVQGKVSSRKLESGVEQNAANSMFLSWEEYLSRYILRIKQDISHTLVVDKILCIKNALTQISFLFTSVGAL